MSSIVKSVVSLFVKGFAKFNIVTFIVSMVVNWAVSQLTNRAFSRGKPPKPVDNGVRQQIPPSTTNSIPIVYGDAFLGGMFVDAVLSQNGNNMYYVMAISSISPNSQVSFDLTKFYYGDRLITFDETDQSKVISLTDQAGNVRQAISDDLFIYLYKSSASGVITPLNTSLMPHEVMAYDPLLPRTVPEELAWPATGRQMNGLAFAIIRLRYNEEQQITGLDPLTFHFSQYLNNQGCARPADVWYDYMTNTLYGGAVDPDLIDTTSVAALNTYSDQTIPYTPAGGGDLQYQPRYRINGVLDAGNNVLDNVNKILDACDSWMNYNAAKGQWAIVVNKPEVAAFNFNDSNIIDDIKVGTIDLTQSINQIEARFPNKLNKDIADYVYIKTPDNLLFPNEPINKQTIDLDLVNNNIQAQYLANRILEQAREDLIVTITTTYEGIQVNAGDVVSITNSAYGWSNKPFRAMKVNEVQQADGMLNAVIELSEYNAQVYDNKDITEFTPSPNSDIPDIAYFSTLFAPTISDQLPNAAIPSFAVNCVIPAQGQVLYVLLYYTNVSNPSETDWYLWSTQQRTGSSAYQPNSTVKFLNISLPTGTYYFAYKVANNIGYSTLSPSSTGYSWSPNPSSSAVAGTFVAQFSPPVLAVPYTNGVPSFNFIEPQLYATTAGGSVDFVAAQTDSDPLFVNNTWRIGGSSTTGYGDITKTNVTIGNPSDAGFYALFPVPSAMSNSPATINVPVRYKATDGTVYQSATAIQQLIFQVNGEDGTDGTKTGTAVLYQWSTAQPANPNGFSTFVWSTATNTNYTGTNGWSTTILPNPSIPSIKLWQASKGVVDTATAISSQVDWSTGFGVFDITQNGAEGSSGLQTANAVVYRWDITTPAGPTGTSTYTWATGQISAAPSGWSLVASTAPLAGYTLFAATVRLVDSATTVTSTINWTLASISAAGYAGDDGTNGANGNSFRLAFARVANNPTPTAGTITTSGGTSYPTTEQSLATWGFNATWGANDPNPASTNSLYQADGIFNPTTNQTVWSTPYISALKVGSLSAITVNTGGLTVSDFIRAGTNPAISGTTMTGNGFTLNSGGTFAMGNATRNFTFNGTTFTINGDLVVTGNLQAGTVSKIYSAAATSITITAQPSSPIIQVTNIPVPNSSTGAMVIFCAQYLNNTTGVNRASAGFRIYRNNAIITNITGAPATQFAAVTVTESQTIISRTIFDNLPTTPTVSYQIIPTGSWSTNANGNLILADITLFVITFQR